jgi:hypothetical protein
MEVFDWNASIYLHSCCNKSYFTYASALDCKECRMNCYYDYNLNCRWADEEQNRASVSCWKAECACDPSQAYIWFVSKILSERFAALWNFALWRYVLSNSSSHYSQLGTVFNFDSRGVCKDATGWDESISIPLTVALSSLQFDEKLNSHYVSEVYR